MKNEERTHLSRVAALGCIVCSNEGHGVTPPEYTAIHHIRSGQGLRRATNFEVLPLCAAHHQTGGYGVAFHAGPKVWQEKYGLEVDLLNQVRDLLK